MTSQQQFCLMPAACARCDKLFDASHDFRGEEEITERELSRESKESLCWECRATGILRVRRR